MQNLDINQNGVIDPDEKEIAIERMRREMLDADSKRDTERRLCVFAASGLILYPIIIVCASYMGLSEAATLLADIAPVYSVAASSVIAAYMGFNKLGKGGDSK